MVYSVFHHIGGQKITEPFEKKQNITNPALGETMGQVHFADMKTCELAVLTAKKAFVEWSKTTAVQRARILFNFRSLLERETENLAKIVCEEHGKTIADAKGSIARGLELVDHHCSILSQLQGRFSSNVASQVDCHTLLQPLGVCVGVSPFNFPVMVPLWMMVPAIACGNAFVLKPSEQDPSAPVRLIELLEEAGLPKGVVNCVHGSKDTVEALISHPDVAAVTAVASSDVAENIYKRATSLGKRSATFGSAKNHALIMPDANLAQAADAIVGAAFGSAGERCMAISVAVLVGPDTAAPFIDALLPRVAAIRVGPGNKADSDMGPLISAVHRERVLHAIDKGVAEGARLLVDGRAYRNPQQPEGFFLGASVFDDVNESMSIYQNEIFGPVLVLMRADTFEEALALVNRNQYGNGTAIFTGSGYFAREFANRVQVGMVGVNIPIPVPIASHPFGGWKRSSFGDTNMQGLESIHYNTRLKTITTKWPAAEMASLTFDMPSH